MTYFIESIGGPIDGEVLEYGTVPHDGYVEIHGEHVYQFNKTEWQFEYYPLTVIHWNGVELRFGSHLHLCRVVGELARRGALSWHDAAVITKQNRVVQLQRVQILENLYREGAL